MPSFRISGLPCPNPLGRQVASGRRRPCHCTGRHSSKEATPQQCLCTCEMMQGSPRAQRYSSPTATGFLRIYWKRSSAHLARVDRTVHIIRPREKSRQSRTVIINHSSYEVPNSRRISGRVEGGRCCTDAPSDSPLGGI